jgi:transposase InsO family protein
MTTLVWPTSELHDDEKAATVTAFVARALSWFDDQGIHAKRLMTDNGWSYTRNSSLRKLLVDREIKHLRTQAYRPQTNGKIERFHQTMAREWAYGMTYKTSRHRDQALTHWLEHYNQRRPHSGIGNRPPITRVHNLLGQDS